jgi:VWFA-related protein
VRAVSFAGACLAVALVSVTWAQQPSFRAAVEVVEIDVSVRRGNRPVAGLTASNFAVTDNGVEQRIDSVTVDRAPLRVTFVLDTSTSVRGFLLSQLVSAGVGVTDVLRAGDQAALVTFSHKVDLVVPMTPSLAQVRGAMTKIVGDGSTSLRDAVHLALQVRPADRGRPLMLVFSDGRDTTSYLTDEDLFASVRRAETVIQTIALRDDAFLQRIAALSGGRSWSARSESALRELFTNALEEMRSRYLITYSPQGPQAPGWHEVKVGLRSAHGEVTARPGYFVDERQPR